ncbi:MutS-related protein [Pedobacter xixiisoli]|uniref:MutS domain III n=1 Tax=Pedobacter xixiisoli TaxID=1476464 RepID=A0A285ZYG1_9SPHI|nr:hypothetical protein [Pedobacter xixiisoli]SOD14637.1 MutS domain III [Pedobacter xixiisoli]
MSFEIDAHTYNDLNIFQNHKSDFSVYDLFKNCKTIYGRQKVQEMMRKPSNDFQFLNERKNAIAYLRKQHIKLDIEDSQIDLILHYLKHGKGKLRGNLVDALVVYLKNKFNETQDYYVVKIGLGNLLLLLNSSYLLSISLETLETPTRLKELGIAIKKLIAQLPIDKSYYISKKTKLNFLDLSKIDAVIRVSKSLKLLYELFDVLYEIDALQTIADTVVQRELTLPEYLNNTTNPNIIIEGLYHPAISSAVKNNLTINHQNHLTFLSGSNMAGKSSLLKSIGIAIYLAHIGFPVPALRMQTTIFNGLITTINIADNVQNGLSHYLSEVMRVKYLLNLLIEKQKIFVILDELFKGTNSKDASEATGLVVDGFSKIKNSAFIISSHITELTERFKNQNISLMHMEHLMESDKPIFTYQLKKGVTKDGIGMYFIHNENIPKLLSFAEKASLNN